MKLWLKKFALLLTSTLFALALLEVGFRVLGYDPNRDDLRRFHPSLGWTIEPDVKAADEINPDGFRFPALPRAKPPGVKRLLVLGDSFAEALSLPWKETFPGRLGEWLNPPGESGPHWEIVNLAVADWGTVQEWAALRDYGFSYDPDLVVLQTFPFNDLCNNSPELANTCSLEDHHRPYLGSDWRFPIRGYSRLFGFLENQWVWHERGLKSDDDSDAARFRVEQSRLRGLPPGYFGALASLLPPDQQPLAVRQAWIETGHALGILADALKSRHIPLIALEIPWIRGVQPHWEAFSRQRYPQAEPGYDCRFFGSILSELDIPFIPCDRFLEGPMKAGDYFLLPADPHLNRYGHAAVARWIIEEMAGRGLVTTQLPSGEGTIRFDLSHPGEGAVAVNGISDDWRRDQSPWRTRGQPRFEAFGPEAVLAFQAGAGRAARIAFEFVSELADTGIQVTVNGSDMFSGTTGAAQPPLSASLPFQTIEGRNEVRFQFTHWTDEEKPGTLARGGRAGEFQLLELNVSDDGPD